ncbi:MAG TPA: Mur ligase family protein [Gaiellaceae bacterium]|nr:Mur ligase family protein [Gaiellaceae bacterium]
MSSRPSAASTGPATDWVAALNPWPEEFGLDRMRVLLERLGHPERRFRSIHVVGTNGKSTATRTIAALLGAEGRRAGAYTSPHVSGWSERIWVDGAEADFERAVARIRFEAEAVAATQFEALTAAALAEFAERGVDVAVVEAGLGGRLDATNVVDAEVVLLTNVSLEHTEVLGDTPGEIAKEKLAVAHAARVVVLPDNQHAELVSNSAEIVTGDERMAAEVFLGRAIEAQPKVSLPGRLERRGRELRDGAHTAAGAAWLREQIHEPVEVIVASILADKDVDGMLAELAPLSDRFVATSSTNPRALSAPELAERARVHFAEVKSEADPVWALELARRTGDGLVLVTGSLYLLADLAAAEEQDVR